MSQQMIMLNNVRISYPNLWEPRAQEEGHAKKFGANFIIEPKGKAITALKGAVKTAIEDGCKGKKPKKPHYNCLRDHTDEDEEEEELRGMFQIVSKSNADSPPVILDANLNVVKSEEKDLIYAGCYVNVKVRIEGYVSQKWGPQVAAKLVAVQFAGDGEAFSASYVSHDEAVDGFEGIGDDDPDDDDDPLA